MKYDERRTMTLTTLEHPPVDALDLATIMGALADQHRLAIVRTLAADGERVCGTFDLGISKATRSHHLKILRESGVTRTRVEGTRRIVSLRRDDLDARFPGLLDALLAAAAR
jgi:DNA-binding transcriptional ArsR family regulator